ncbi:hypothetical protein PC9H_005912 [Pleurotus ostreatus]|uniref:Uncharacterized protein n=1 Tax=Pleurotus ostreatus TaxID=5322 RepID=A0A8H6ZVQ0_PLEOS|nr:uncharacterized protein PC9H_005912 [Pleurotus ostreatus]KAF7430210.1 hypothetical protein PC9H_005912 [Pleurotus ostreatus]KAJ8701290.1 hypothetical protein PTI98_000094 [Pleurotus ostreatus]
MSVLLRDRLLATDPETFWATASNLLNMAKDPQYNHRLTEYAWYSLWTTIFTDLAAGMRARARSQQFIFAPAPQFCLWAPIPHSATMQRAIMPENPPTDVVISLTDQDIVTPSDESISTGRASNSQSTSTDSSNPTQAPRSFRLPDVSMLGISARSPDVKERLSIHHSDITGFVIPFILEVKPEGVLSDMSEAQNELTVQAMYLFAAYKQDTVIGIVAAGSSFRHAIFRREDFQGSISTASELVDTSYSPSNDKTEWKPLEAFGKGSFHTTLMSIVRTAFEEVLGLPYVKNFKGPPHCHAGDSASLQPPASRTRSKTQPKGQGGKGKAGATGKTKSKGKGKAPEAGPSMPRN